MPASRKAFAAGKCTWLGVTMATGFLLVDVAFWSANLPKIPHGGWFPLVIAGIVFTLMTTWKTGRALLLGKRNNFV